MTTNTIVDFERPPVVETVLGMHFEHLSKFRNAHLGAFWKSLPSEWTTVADAGALPEQVEQFDRLSGAAGPGIMFTNQPEVRMQIRNAAGDRMLQLQNGQLHYNWLGQGGGEYSRYPRLLAEFVEMKSRFDRFAADERLGDVKPQQWEVTYVNQIPRGEIWNSPAD